MDWCVKKAETQQKSSVMTGQVGSQLTMSAEYHEFLKSYPCWLQWPVDADSSYTASGFRKMTGGSDQAVWPRSNRRPIVRLQWPSDHMDSLTETNAPLKPVRTFHFDRPSCSAICVILQFRRFQPQSYCFTVANHTATMHCIETEVTL